jgi:transcription antitermination factor NusG
MSEKKRNWYALYTKPRWEKKVYGLLAEKGFEVYCPLNRVRKKWSDRIKWVEEPLFKSYVFVKVSEEDRSLVRMINGVVNYVYWLGKPAIVKDKEIEIIRKFLNEYREVEALPMDLQVDVKVTISKGAFMGQEATIIKLLNNKVRVNIASIGYSLQAIIDRSNISATGK